MESKSIQGASIMKLLFHPDTDMSQAMSETVAQVNHSRAFMPPATAAPFIMRFDAGSVAVGYLVFSTDDPNITLGQMQDQALNRVRPAFATLPGVSAPPLFGGSSRAITVNVNPDRLRALGLSQVLHMPAKVELQPDDDNPAPMNLPEAARSLDALAAQALERRPELAMSAEQLAAAISTGFGAKWAPLVPAIRAEYFYGGLGGGTHDDGPRHFNDTADYGIGLTWRIGPGGLFDRSHTDIADPKTRGIEIQWDKLRDEITRQVVEAHTRVHSLKDQLTLARKALETSGQALTLARARQAFGVGEVLENIQAEQDLTRARFDYLAAITGLNRAQFLLRRAVGLDGTQRAGK